MCKWLASFGKGILQRIWLNFMALCLVFIPRFWISNFFDQSITEVVEMRISCIKSGNVFVLDFNILKNMAPEYMYLFHIFLNISVMNFVITLCIPAPRHLKNT
jgi:hypothetical protein